GPRQEGAAFRWQTLARARRAWAEAVASEASRRGRGALERDQEMVHEFRRAAETGTLENGAKSPESAACWDRSRQPKALGTVVRGSVNPRQGNGHHRLDYNADTSKAKNALTKGCSGGGHVVD